MFLSKISDFFKNRQAGELPRQTDDAGKKIYYPFSIWYVERGIPVLFINEKTGASKTIVDEHGKILNFPGIEDSGKVRQIVDDPNCLKPYTRYGGSFERRGEEYIMLWTVQPDGRYWEDEDGFGGTSDEEVMMYALIDKKGRFKTPFRLYKVGRTRYEISA